MLVNLCMRCSRAPGGQCLLCHAVWRQEVKMVVHRLAPPSHQLCSMPSKADFSSCMPTGCRSPAWISSCRGAQPDDPAPNRGMLMQHELLGPGLRSPEQGHAEQIGCSSHCLWS